MGSLKRRLLPLLLSLVLLCACTAGTPDHSPGAAPSEPSPSQAQSYVSPSPSPSETAPSEFPPSISPTPAAVLPEPSPSQTAPVPLPSPSAAPVSESPVMDTAEEEPVEVVVYVTKTGEKYHSDGCQYLSKSRIPISLDDAKASGYTPCSKCHPPR